MKKLLCFVAMILSLVCVFTSCGGKHKDEVMAVCHFMRYFDEDENLAEVKMIDTTDMDGRTIKGLGLVQYDNRLWLFDGNVLRYSVQNNIYDWATSDATIQTSAGYIEYTKPITSIHLYLSSLAIFFKDSSIQLQGTYPYSQGEESPGGCAGVHAKVYHGKELYFYDDTKKGIFSFSQIVLGDKTIGEKIFSLYKCNFEWRRCYF